MNKLVFRYIAFYLFVFLSCNVSAFSSIDSLENELANATSSKTYIDLLFELIEETQFVDRERALGYAEDGIAFSDSIGNKEYLAYFYNRLGSLLSDGGDNNKSIEYYEKSLEILSELDIKGKEAVAYMNIGIAHMYEGRYKKAEENYDLSLAIHVASDNRSGVADIYSKKALSRLFRAQYKDGLKFLFDAAELLEDLKDEYRLSEVYGNIALTYSNIQDYRKAVEYQKKVISLVGDESGYSPAIADLNMGLYLYYLHEPDSALKYYSRAYEILNESGYPGEAAQALSNMSIVFSEIGDELKAIELINKSIEIHRSVENNEGLANALNNLGFIYYSAAIDTTTEIGSKSLRSKESKKDLLRSSENYYKESISLYVETGNLDAEGSTYANLANTYKEQKEWEKAYNANERYRILSDSVFSRENQRAIGRLEAERDRIVEEFEQKEKKRQEEEKIAQRNRLQYLGIAAIVVAFGIIMLLSGRLNLPQTFARGLVFLGFIFLFEFLLVLADPWIDDYSAGVPVVKFAVNLIIALIIFPVHQFFEVRVTKKIIKEKKE